MFIKTANRVFERSDIECVNLNVIIVRIQAYRVNALKRGFPFGGGDGNNLCLIMACVLYM